MIIISQKLKVMFQKYLYKVILQNMIITISPPKNVEKRLGCEVSLKATTRDKQRQLYKITYLKRLPLSSML